MTVRELNVADYKPRLTFTETMLYMFEENKALKRLMSDEAHKGCY